MTMMSPGRLPALGAAAVLALLSASPGRAADLLTTHRVPAALAQEAVGAAVAACAKQRYAVSAVVLDADGVHQAVLRGDAAGVHTMESANDKAYTSVTFKTDSGVLAERGANTPIAVLTAKLPHLLMVQGGLVIKVGDEVVGGIGVAGAPGGNLDEGCARAGLDAIRGRLQ